MAYKYSPPPGGSPATIQLEIAAEFERWNDMAGEKVIGAYDFPVPSKIGGKDAMVRFEYYGQPRTVSCGRWPDYDVNLKCIQLVLRDRRLAQARGIADVARQVFEALPPPATPGDPYALLGVSPGVAEHLVRAAYREKARQAHPDHGGSNHLMTAVNAAWDAIRAERGWK